jgi:hypothetical protein
MEIQIDNLELIRTIVRKNRIKDANLVTGFSVKKFLRNKILSKSDLPLSNYKLENNQYRVFAHQNILSSFTNILKHLEIKKGGVILSHPFLPVELVDNLITDDYKVKSLEIEEKTLTTNFKIVQDFCENNPNPDLVIFYSFTDLFKEVKETIEYLKSKSIKVLIVDNNPFITSEFYEVINSINDGAYIQIVGTSPVSYILKEALDIKVKEEDFYLSWVYSTNLVSALKIEEIKNLEEQQDFLDLLLYYMDSKDSLEEYNIENLKKKNPIFEAKKKALSVRNLLLDTVIFNKDYQQIYTIVSKRKIGPITFGKKKTFDKEKLDKDFIEKYSQLSKDNLADYWFDIYFALRLELNNWIEKDLTQMYNHIKTTHQNIMSVTQEIDAKHSEYGISYYNLGRIPCAFYVYSKKEKQLDLYKMYKENGIDMYTIPKAHQIFIDLDNKGIVKKIQDTCLVKKY